MSDKSLTGGTVDPAMQSAIEADIRETRSVISEDIRAIGDKLSPENLKSEAIDMANHAKEAAKEAAKDYATQAKEAAVTKMREVKDRAVETVSEKFDDVEYQARRAGGATVHFVRDNAVPLALIGVGLGWLLASSRNTTGDDWVAPRRRSRLATATDGYRERMRHGVDTARERVSDARWRAEQGAHDLRQRAEQGAHDLRQRAEHKLGEVAERAEHTYTEGKQRARELGHRAQQRLHDAEIRSRDFALDNPLAVGAVAIAAGIGVGMLLPSTQKENQLLGPARDRLVDGAKQTAEELGRTVKQTAEDVKSSVTEQLQH